MDKEKSSFEQQLQSHSQNKNLSPGINLSTDLLIDADLEKKNCVRNSFVGLKEIPFDIKMHSEAEIVLLTLTQCFQNNGNVCEGEVANIVWGFEQCGIPSKLTAVGLNQLKKLGYIFYSDSNLNPISDLDAIDHSRKEIWIRYTSKLLNLLLQKS